MHVLSNNVDPAFSPSRELLHAYRKAAFETDRAIDKELSEAYPEERASFLENAVSAILYVPFVSFLWVMDYASHKIQGQRLLPGIQAYNPNKVSGRDQLQYQIYGSLIDVANKKEWIEEFGGEVPEECGIVITQERKLHADLIERFEYSTRLRSNLPQGMSFYSTLGTELSDWMDSGPQFNSWWELQENPDRSVSARRKLK